MCPIEILVDLDCVKLSVNFNHYQKLILNGNVDLEVILDGYTLQPGMRKYIAHSGGGVVGKFSCGDSLVVDGYTLYLSYEGNYVYLQTDPPAVTDIDGDGVPDDEDNCPDTPTGEAVDANGCSASQLDDDGDGVSNADDNCPDTLIPESVPTVRLGTNRWALVDGDFIFDTNAPKGKGPKRSYTTTDTGGCSCEQIIAAQGLGKGHTKFGCSISAMDDWVALVNP